MKKYLNERMLCKNDNYIISYKKSYIYVRDNNKQIIKKKRICGLIGKSKLLSRLLRIEPRTGFFINNSNVLISFNGFLYNYNIEKNSLQIELEYKKNMKNPLNFCVIDTAKVKRVLFGEYIWNENKGAVSIYCRENKKWRIIYEFKEETITHIHNIIYDRNRKCLFILTGDKDNESGIWISDIDFKEVKPLLIGKQLYRSCTAFPTENGLIYATDTPLEQNYINEIIIKNNKVSDIKQICKIPGPCIYGLQKENEFYFSTSVEPNPYLSKWRYRITYKLGNGVKERYSYIIGIFNKSDRIILKIKKDILPMWLFQFGNIQFISADLNKIYIVPKALCIGHDITYSIERMKKNEGE